MRNREQWVLPTILHRDNEARAAAALKKYFEPGATTAPLFTGSRFERFAGGGDRPEVANLFTSDDLVAVTMLNVNVPGAAALRLLADRSDVNRREIAELFARLPLDLDLANADDEQLDIGNQLWIAVRRGCKVGPTTTSKLLARKRPKLLPVIDSVVAAQLAHNSRRTDFYRELRRNLRVDSSSLAKRLAHLRNDTGTSEEISVIRCLDVILWMDGTGRIP